MTLETKTNLNDDTIEKLQKLIRANIDSYDGYRESAEKLSDPALTKLFHEIAEQRSQFATELQRNVEWNGAEAEDDGSVAAKTHRVWINIRSKLTTDDVQVILDEAERGEDHIKQAYEDVLKQTSGSAMNDVLQSQYAKVKAGHDKVRDARDARRNAK